jgi:hypothetical protein
MMSAEQRDYVRQECGKFGCITDKGEVLCLLRHADAADALFAEVRTFLRDLIANTNDIAAQNAAREVLEKLN